LVSLQDEAASDVARALRRQPEAAAWLAGNDPPRGLAPVLADALRPAIQQSTRTEAAPDAPAPVPAIWGPGEGVGAGPFNLHGTGSPFNAHMKNLSGKDQLITQAKLVTDIGVFEAFRGASDQNGEEELPSASLPGGWDAFPSTPRSGQPEPGSRRADRA
jgi:hypothetical protein